MSEDKAPSVAPDKPVAVERTPEKAVAAKVVPEPAQAVTAASSERKEDTSTHVIEAVPPPGRIRRSKTKELTPRDRIPSNWVIQNGDKKDTIIARSSDNNFFEGTRKEFIKFLGS